MSVDGVVAERVDFFVSYAGPDRAWAQWAGAQLEAAGYRVELDVWDWAAGENVVLRMSDALDRADRVLALWSPAYFERPRFTTDEWTAVLTERPDGRGQRGRLVPVRVAAVVPPTVLGPFLVRDLFGLPEFKARAELLAAVGGPNGRGQHHPFPGTIDGNENGSVEGPRVPGSLPPIWNVPPRNLWFTGRRAELANLRERLGGGGREWVQALNGIGGVGKTQLAIEYAHLFAGDYDLMWWIDAQRPELIAEQVAALAAVTGCATLERRAEEAARRAIDRLTHMSRWLLVFDNVEDPDQVRRWLPDGGGHVILTSRRQAWIGIASPVNVEVFTREDSVSLLQTYLPTMAEADARRVAEALGDLPLAIAQAGGLLAEIRMPVAEYLEELAEHAAEILTHGTGHEYPQSLAAGLKMSLERLREVDPAAVAVLNVASVLAPEPIPVGWFRTSALEVLPEVLVPVVARHLAWRRTLARLHELGLAVVTEHTLQVHRLTQAVLRDHRDPNLLVQDRDHAIALIAAVSPANYGTDPASWPAWAALLPHLLAVDPAHASASLRATAPRALWYLLQRGEYRTLLMLAKAWHAVWQANNGPDDPHTLHAAHGLAVAMYVLGRHQEAHDLHQATHDTRSRVLGPDHPDTLHSAHGMALALNRLGRHQEAHDLHQTTHASYQRILGPDHPDTLHSAQGIAVALVGLGRHQEAYDLHQTTHASYQRILGTDHPHTLASAHGLALALTGLGRHQEAHDLHQTTHASYQRILGPDHPDTLHSAQGIAVALAGVSDDHEF